MSKHHAARRGPLRSVGRAGAIVAGGVLAVSAIVTGTALASEDYGPSEGAGFSPTTPVDAFVDHWSQYHYGKDITGEPGTIMADPEKYMEIHQEMAKAMLGQGGMSDH